MFPSKGRILNFVRVTEVLTRIHQGTLMSLGSRQLSRRGLILTASRLFVSSGHVEHGLMKGLGF